MELARAVRRAQDAQLERIDVSGTKAALLARPPRRARKKRAAAAMAMAAIAFGILAFVLWPRSLVFWIDGVEGRPGEWMAAPADAPIVLSFSEGTRFELAPDARARISEIDAHGARLVVERGDVHVSVVHRQEGRWSVELGPYAISVIGTRFVAGWRPESETLSIELLEGKVRVAGPHLEEGFTMTSGHRLEVDRSTVNLRGVAEAPRAVDAPKETPKPKAGTPAPATSSSTATWKQHARDGRYQDALREARKLGFEQLCAATDAESLALLADAARFAGDARAAEHALQTMRRRFPGERAARAAFLLGRLAFDADPAAAARWFETYMAEAPSGALVREAAGRLIEAQVAAKNDAAAEKAARDYLARHPDGPHAPLARRVLKL